KRMNWKDPLGKKFQAGGGPGSIDKRVVGVIKDYNQNSLYDAIEPLIILLAKDQNCNYMFVRLSKGDVSAMLKNVQRVWSEVFPNNPFEYAFLDEDLDSQYKADQKRSRIFTAFSMLTMVIACLGLLGLAAYSTEQRTREIGVRKVIGAGIPSLVRLMAREFLVLVFIGMIIAFPAAWYFTNQWLQNFTYRIQMNGEWLTFLLSALAAMTITLLTVGYHVVKTAMANPVNSLRVE
ncbi:MAG: FtsX-like permease family protein, partial [Bacteroidetes bacterium]|nr:FtsX-like permease family protein [Bacteroidota bacterium]